MDAIKMSVSHDEAVKFCENALRNLPHFPLSSDDVADIAGALAWFLRKRVTDATLARLTNGGQDNG